MAWLTRRSLHLMVTVLAGITVERPSGSIWALAVGANVASGLLSLAPAFGLYQSWKKGTLAEKMATYGYGFDFWNNLMYICFGVLYLPLPTAKFVIIINSIGAAAQTGYLLFCIRYTSWNQHKRAIVVFFTGTICFGVVLSLVLAKTISHNKAIQIVGGLAIATGLLSSLSTFYNLVKMLKARNLSGVDKVSVVFALPSGCLWISYGFKLHPVNIFVVIPISVSLFIAVVQILGVIIFKTCVDPVLPVVDPPPPPPPPPSPQIELPIVVAEAQSQDVVLSLPLQHVTDDRGDDPAELFPVAPAAASASVTDGSVRDTTILDLIDDLTSSDSLDAHDQVDDPAELPLAASATSVDDHISSTSVTIHNLAELPSAASASSASPSVSPFVDAQSSHTSSASMDDHISSASATGDRADDPAELSPASSAADDHV